MQNVLITGANRGIGLAHAKRFAERGFRVYATARTPAEATELRALAAAHRGRVTILGYDADDEDAPRKLKSNIGDEPLDILFANAGVIGDRKGFGAINPEAVLETIRVNALAPLKLAEAFADNVAASERKIMAFQSSKMGSIADNSSGGAYAYRLSKAALNMVARGVSVDLRGRGVIAVALHPGWVQTRMGGASAPVSVENCVEGQQKLFDRLTPAMSGHFYNYDGAEIPW